MNSLTQTGQTARPEQAELQLHCQTHTKLQIKAETDCTAGMDAFTNLCRSDNHFNACKLQATLK